MDKKKEIIQNYKDRGCKLDDNIDTCGRGVLPNNTRFWRPIAYGQITSHFGNRCFWLNGSYTLNFESNKQFETLHRGFVQTAFGWKNDIFNVKADVGIVFGNQMEPNKFIIPFTVGVYLNMPSYFSTRNFIVSLYGGLDSKETSIDSLEFSIISSLDDKLSDEI